MTTNAINRWIVLFIIIGISLAGCSREEPPATATPPAPVKPAGPPPDDRTVVVDEKSSAVPVAPIPPVSSDTTVSSTLKIACIDPLQLHRVELASEALAVWRQYAAQRPTLLLLSDQPMLMAVPPALAASVADFVTTATPAELARRSHPKAPDVLLIPEMTVDIALRRNWIGKLGWVLPLRDASQGLNLEPFRKRLQEQGLATAEEAATLRGDRERLQGMLRGVPVELATLDKQSAVTGPVILHLDMSYFKNLYKNDMATPLMNLVFETLTRLRERKLPVLAVTFSYGNLDERIALDVRFVGEVVATLFAHPEMFNRPVPVNWVRQDQILYLYNLFQKEKARELALAQEKDLPGAAWVKFNLYQAAAAFHEGDKAMAYLEQAVRLDKVYALEYLNLAQMAYDKKMPGDALRMLKLAATVFPSDPSIRLQLAQLTAELGDHKTALHLVRQLQALPWSLDYNRQVPGDLQAFAEFLQQAPPPSPPPTPTVPEQRKPISPAGPARVKPPGHP